jgi:hypothetical protein
MTGRLDLPAIKGKAVEDSSTKTGASECRHVLNIPRPLLDGTCEAGSRFGKVHFPENALVSQDARLRLHARTFPSSQQVLPEFGKPFWLLFRLLRTFGLNGKFSGGVYDKRIPHETSPNNHLVSQTASIDQVHLHGAGNISQADREHHHRSSALLSLRTLYSRQSNQFAFKLNTLALIIYHFEAHPALASALESVYRASVQRRVVSSRIQFCAEDESARIDANVFYHANHGHSLGGNALSDRKDRDHKQQAKEQGFHDTSHYETSLTNGPYVRPSAASFPSKDTVKIDSPFLCGDVRSQLTGTYRLGSAMYSAAGLTRVRSSRKLRPRSKGYLCRERSAKFTNVFLQCFPRQISSMTKGRSSAFP